MFWMLGHLEDADTLYLAEGFATGATIAEVTGKPCAVAYSASNLVSVAGILKQRTQPWTFASWQTTMRQALGNGTQNKQVQNLGYA